MCSEWPPTVIYCTVSITGSRTNAGIHVCCKTTCTVTYELFWLCYTTNSEQLFLCPLTGAASRCLLWHRQTEKQVTEHSTRQMRIWRRHSALPASPPNRFLTGQAADLVSVRDVDVPLISGLMGSSGWWAGSVTKRLVTSQRYNTT